MVFLVNSFAKCFAKCLARVALALSVLVLPSHGQVLNQAQEAHLNDISQYLNTLATAQGTFVQANPDGSDTGGNFYLSRPGRMRFDYEEPNKSLVVVSGGSIAIFDQYSNSEPQQFPLARTPLSLILERVVDLSNRDMIFDMRDNGDSTSVFARDVERPELGFVEITFTKSPIALTGWVITDEQSKRTSVRLVELERVDLIPLRFFNILRINEERKLN